MPTAADATFEELVTLDILSLADAIARQERDESTELRLTCALFTDGESEQAWESFRRGCLFNGLPVEINERIARTTIRLYGLHFGIDSFASIHVW